MRVAFAIFCFTLVAACAPSIRGGLTPPPADLALTHSTVVDVENGRLLAHQTVLIRGDRIAAVGPSHGVPVPQGAQICDAQGKYLIPGLADMHVHFGRGGGLPNTPESVERALRQYLFYGVTTVLNLGAYSGRADEIIELRRRQAEGQILAPNIYATGGLLTVPGSHPINRWARDLPEGIDPETHDWSQRGVWVVRTSAEVREVVARMAAAGMDGIKVVIESGPENDPFPRMPAEMIEAAIEEASRHGLPVFAHATSVNELEDAVEAGVRAVVHLVGPELPGADLLAAMRQKDIYYVPTLSVFISADVWGDPSKNLTDQFLRSGAEARLIEALLASPSNPTTRPAEEDWARRGAVLRALKAAHDAGVKLAAGSDPPGGLRFHGYSMHHELELMVEAGLTPAEAIFAATRRPAELLGQADVFGTIAPGMRADLVLLSANPLEDIRNTRTLEMVIVKGKVIDRATLLPRE